MRCRKGSRRKQKAADASAPTALNGLTNEMQVLFAGAPKNGALR